MHRVHRALGGLFALLIVLWFASGAVMTFAGYPRLDEAERRALAAPLPLEVPLAVPAQLARFLAEGASTHGARARLAMLEGTPTWLFGEGRARVALRAREPFEVAPLDHVRVRTEATRRLGLPVASSELQTESDQWTVAFARAGVLPLYRVHFADRDHTQAYFSARTGDLLQLSTRSERTLAWLGPIPHWIYPTLLRRERALWRYTVLTLSAFGLLLTLSGTAAGLHVWRTLHKRGAPPRDPYLRWHQTLGLWFGLFVSSWLFSGALSLTPFQWTGERPASAREQSALYGAPGGATAWDITAALRSCSRELTVRELELTPLAGRLYAVCSDARQQTRLVDLTDPQLRARRSLSTLELEQLAARLADAARPASGAQEPRAQPAHSQLGKRAQDVGASTVVADTYDAYHYPTHGSPDAALPYARLALEDNEQTTYYVDPARAQLLRKHTARTRLERWLYQGLHCFDLPGLYERRVLWRTLMLAALALGSGLSGLGVAMTWRRWRRAALRRSRRPVATRLPARAPAPTATTARLTAATREVTCAADQPERS